jgi:hypothetical protein
MFQKYPFQLLCGVGCLLVWVVTGLPLEAHQIPSLTVEALFSKDRSYLIRINVDPRLFLSSQPSSLPPVPIEWFMDQSEPQKNDTFKAAEAYLQKALKLKFGSSLVPLPPSEFRPMDGATNQPLAESTKEVHLLAEAKGIAPEDAGTFEAVLTQEAGVSMILLSSFEGEMEKRPNVVFPGESSRSFRLPFVVEAPPKPKVLPAEKLAKTEHGLRGFPVLAIGSGVLLLVLLFSWLRARRRSQGL